MQRKTISVSSTESYEFDLDRYNAHLYSYDPRSVAVIENIKKITGEKEFSVWLKEMENEVERLKSRNSKLRLFLEKNKLSNVQEILDKNPAPQNTCIFDALKKAKEILEVDRKGNSLYLDKFDYKDDNLVLTSYVVNLKLQLDSIFNEYGRGLNQRNRSKLDNYKLLISNMLRSLNEKIVAFYSLCSSRQSPNTFKLQVEKQKEIASIMVDINNTKKLISTIFPARIDAVVIGGNMGHRSDFVSKCGVSKKQIQESSLNTDFRDNALMKFSDNKFKLVHGGIYFYLNASRDEVYYSNHFLNAEADTVFLLIGKTGWDEIRQVMNQLFGYIPCYDRSNKKLSIYMIEAREGEISELEKESMREKVDTFLIGRSNFKVIWWPEKLADLSNDKMKLMLSDVRRNCLGENIPEVKDPFVLAHRQLTALVSDYENLIKDRPDLISRVYVQTDCQPLAAWLESAKQKRNELYDKWKNAYTYAFIPMADTEGTKLDNFTKIYLEKMTAIISIINDVKNNPEKVVNAVKADDIQSDLNIEDFEIIDQHPKEIQPAEKEEKVVDAVADVPAEAPAQTKAEAFGEKKVKQYMFNSKYRDDRLKALKKEEKEAYYNKNIFEL